MKKRACFVPFILSEGNFFQHGCFILMYNILNVQSEYTYFYITKNVTTYSFLVVSKIVESLQCVLNKKIFIKILSL